MNAAEILTIIGSVVIFVCGAFALLGQPQQQSEYQAVHSTRLIVAWVIVGVLFIAAATMMK